jgi:TPR repeat protein
VLDADEIAALVKRGQDFATNGDHLSARLLLRRAAEAGSAEAALALGETFDPIIFQRLHVIGIEPDAASAQKWYQRSCGAWLSRHVTASRKASRLGALRLSRFSRAHLSRRRGGRSGWATQARPGTNAFNERTSAQKQPQAEMRLEAAQL